MNIRNFLSAPKTKTTHKPGGLGEMRYSRVWQGTDFATPWSFVDHVVLPPNASIGLHTHGDNEEMYIVLSGCGTMTVDGEVSKVQKGDMILNKISGYHGLVNDGASDLEFLVVEVALGT